jgi:hypothetical protein
MNQTPRIFALYRVPFPQALSRHSRQEERAQSPPLPLTTPSWLGELELDDGSSFKARFRLYKAALLGWSSTPVCNEELWRWPGRQSRPAVGGMVALVRGNVLSHVAENEGAGASKSAPDAWKHGAALSCCPNHQNLAQYAD